MGLRSRFFLLFLFLFLFPFFVTWGEDIDLSSFSVFIFLQRLFYFLFSLFASWGRDLDDDDDHDVNCRQLCIDDEQEDN